MGLSATGVVILVAGLAFIAGFSVALRVGPQAPPTPEGSLVFFASRLVAGAGVAAGALGIYAAIKTQVLADDIVGHPVAFRLAEQLRDALSHSAVLLLLACALASLGVRLPARG